MTHYSTLGVGEDAGPEDIKRAYRKLANQYHPDKGGDTNKFQEIQTAYDTLSDPSRKQQYDMERQGFGGMHGHPNGFQFHFNHGDINDIFRQFGFGGGGDPFGHFRQQQPRRNKDLRVEIIIPLASTLEEQSKTISVQTTNGERSTVEVVIPRGVTPGTQIKYSGLGDNMFNTLPRGDLYVVLNVQAAPGFDINGIDLYRRTSVNCLLAVVGGEIEVVGLDQRTFSLTIPPGTPAGTKFRLHRQGLYQMHSDQRGDLYVEIQLEVPQNLSAEDLNTIRSIVHSK